jgi:CheY-like chemotaxis protein/nitrogen-specific signal transduction histidine kinase
MIANLRAQRSALEQHSAELARANGEAQLARAAAEQASQLKSEFLANMSHELRTPLNSIINFTRILASGMRGPVNLDQIDYLNRVRTSGEHLLGLINDILDLSKIESGRMELYAESIQVAEIIQGVMSTASGLTKGKPIELYQEIALGLPLIEADRTRLRQILLNLISNAAKFTERGSIAVQARFDGAHILVSVTDTGIGIAPEHLGAIFEEFRQIESATNRRYEGTGLGLAICRKLVELHGGKIWLESTPGIGSTFTFSLPVAGALPGAAEAALVASAEVRGVPVLVIDDDPAAIEIVATYLAHDGYSVYGITDSRRAIEEARLIRPAAIILDVLMPYKDGWEVLAELKEDAELCAVPVVLFSIVEERKLGFYLGASAYLIKPVDADELRTTVTRLVAGDATILVIDDDPNALEIVSHQLEQAGAYRVVTASGGQLGLDRVSDARPDLIVLDLMMPEVDGFTVLDALERQPGSRDIPVIVLTAKDLTAQERDFLHHRVSGLLLKGQTPEDLLLGKVRDLLRPAALSATPAETGKE